MRILIPLMLLTGCVSYPVDHVHTYDPHPVYVRPSAVITIPVEPEYRYHPHPHRYWYRNKRRYRNR